MRKNLERNEREDFREEEERTIMWTENKREEDEGGKRRRRRGRSGISNGTFRDHLNKSLIKINISQLNYGSDRKYEEVMC